MISDHVSRRCKLVLLIAVATGPVAACLEPGSSPPGADPPAGAEREEYRIRLPDGRTGTVTGTREGDRLVIGGDMAIWLGSEGPGTRSAVVPNAKLWQSKAIAYEFSAGIDATMRQRVVSAMGPWTAAGFVFLPRTTQTSFVRIDGPADLDHLWRCRADIGFQGGIAIYNAASGCRTRDLVHEWGHVLGLYHEHERSDRDQFIRVIDTRIGSITALGGIDSGTYDFGSIMHYDAYNRREDGSIDDVRNPDGSIDDSHLAFRPRDNRSLSSFGFNETPSEQDLSTLSFLYRDRVPGVPLYQLYSAQYQDWFYTIDSNVRTVAIQVYGYADFGVSARVELAPIGGTAPFRRLYKGPPQTDHFYTTSLDEFNTVLGLGWVDEGAEGYLFTSPSPGLVALYRFSHWEAATSNLMHFYTTNLAMRSSLESAGWALDAVAGYVYGP